MLNNQNYKLFNKVITFFNKVFSYDLTSLILQYQIDGDCSLVFARQRFGLRGMFRGERFN